MRLVGSSEKIYFLGSDHHNSCPYTAHAYCCLGGLFSGNVKQTGRQTDRRETFSGTYFCEGFFLPLFSSSSKQKVIIQIIWIFRRETCLGRGYNSNNNNNNNNNNNRVTQIFLFALFGNDLVIDFELHLLMSGAKIFSAANSLIMLLVVVVVVVVVVVHIPNLLCIGRFFVVVSIMTIRSQRMS